MKVYRGSLLNAIILLVTGILGWKDFVTNAMLFDDVAPYAKVAILLVIGLSLKRAWRFFFFSQGPSRWKKKRSQTFRSRKGSKVKVLTSIFGCKPTLERGVHLATSIGINLGSNRLEGCT